MLLMSTLAFTVCFAAWMLNGVLVTHLTVNQVFNWSASEIGWLLGIPVLTGSIFRLPAGVLTDKFGGKPVFTALLLFCALPMFLLFPLFQRWWGFHGALGGSAMLTLLLFALLRAITARFGLML